jgi:hypothetical protein
MQIRIRGSVFYADPGPIIHALEDPSLTREISSFFGAIPGSYRFVPTQRADPDPEHPNTNKWHHRLLLISETLTNCHTVSK